MSAQDAVDQELVVVERNIRVGPLMIAQDSFSAGGSAVMDFAMYQPYSGYVQLQPGPDRSDRVLVSFAELIAAVKLYQTLKGPVAAALKQDEQQ